MAFALLALLGAASPATAHGEQFARAEKIWPLLDKQQPEKLEGVTIRVEHNSVGSWLIAKNNTRKPLEIHDADGEPFLRLGPEGIEYNRFAEEYYLTKAFPENPPTEVRENPQAEPEWVHLTDGPTVAWQDRRVATEGMVVAEQVSIKMRRAQEDADIGRWSIPVRLGESEAELRGRYRYDAPPQGGYAAKLTSDAESPDIAVRLLHGVSGATDALSLQNRSGEPVTVFEASGEPAIRIGPKKTLVNVNSPVGRSTAALRRGSSVEASLEKGRPEWKTVAGGSGFIWLDPRLRPSGALPRPDDPETARKVGRWKVPIRVGGEKQFLSGEIEWQPSSWKPPVSQGGESGGIGVQQVMTVGAVTLLPAAGILAVLMGPGLLKHYRYRRQ